MNTEFLRTLYAPTEGGASGEGGEGGTPANGENPTNEGSDPTEGGTNNPISNHSQQKKKQFQKLNTISLQVS